MVNAGKKLEVFHTTRWSVVCAARDAQDPQFRTALGELCRIYWPPLYAYARRVGQTHQDAEDSVQAFLALLIEKDAMRGVAPVRGKFRTFLLHCFKNFLSNQWKRARSIKRGRAHQPLSLDYERFAERADPSLCENLTPEQWFDRQWGQMVIDRAFAALKSRVLDPLNTVLLDSLCPRQSRETPMTESVAALAQQLGITEENVKIRKYRLRQRLGHLIRQEILQTVATEAEVDEEIQYLMRCVATG
jgi:RNA polymerase sigma-70 factor (ECF subfamily)